jgi:hypothetical protein
VADITALIVKISPDGNLVFDKQFDGRGGETADGVAVAPEDGTIYISGGTTSFGAGSQDAFVLHIQATGKKLIDAVAWGGTGLDTGASVAVEGATIALAATTQSAPPHPLLPIAARLSAPRGTLSASAGALDVATGVVANPAAGATTPNGSTTFGGNFEAAVVQIAR